MKVEKLGSVEEIQNQIKELEAKKKALELAIQKQADEKRKTVVPQHRFTFTPVTRGYDVIWDDTCQWYYLNHAVANLEECKAVGWEASGFHQSLSHNQGMTYLYNGATGKIVMASGGGTIFVLAHESFTKIKKDVDEGMEALKNLAGFIKEHPEGGDVTAIILKQTGLHLAGRTFA